MAQHPEHTLREISLQQTPATAQHTHPWWQVMCLTGVDYFSTLGYQPGIAYIAAEALSPVATVILVLVTLLCALPMYNKVAAASPHGQGSISMLEDLFARWKGKSVVLVLLGFAVTGFVITITLSAADATAHIIENPLAPHWMHHRLIVTFVLLFLLGGVLLKGFKEAIGVAVVIVIVYLGLNVVVVGYGVLELAGHPEALATWKESLLDGPTHGEPWRIFLMAVLVFPALALGLSGFETGVAVMPLVKGEPGDDPAHPAGRIRNTKKLLATAALIMSVTLIGSSIVTTLLIPISSPQGEAAFHEGGEAQGRALSFLAHHFFGGVFGTVYDVATIAILWFAGASALAGLLTLIPRYLPRYGMAPEWAKATRPLVLVILFLTIVVTAIFRADVERQAGAYATGVLGLMTSGAIAVAIQQWRARKARWVFLAIAVVFVYATSANIIERPEGIIAASIFVAAIIVTSLVSRAWRSTELRVHGVLLDDTAKRFVQEAAAGGAIRIVANRPDSGDLNEYRKKEQEARESHHIPADEQILILEVRPGDVSEFADEVLEVSGVTVGPYRVLRCESPAVPNAIAAILLHIARHHRKLPHIYFGWTEGNPLYYVMKFIVFGEGDTAPVTREILRQQIEDPAKRPRVHVG